MEFLILLEILLAAAAIGAVLFIRKLARQDKAAENEKFDKK